MKKLIQSAENFARNCLSTHAGDGHDLDHTFRVVKHALNLCREIHEANENIVHIAALLHDIARPQESADAGKSDHAAVGAEMALIFLREYGVDETTALHIAACIATHRFRSDNRPGTVEAEILYVPVPHKTRCDERPSRRDRKVCRSRSEDLRHTEFLTDNSLFHFAFLHIMVIG